jgi:cysteinyl-tRNA synthetase
MKLYNTLTKKTEYFKPQQPPTVKIYSCGPTVYDYAHIGHWYTYVRTDTLIRVLISQGFKPDWVMNITDVGHLTSDADDGEDKLQKGAQREGKTAWQIAEFYTADFLEGMKQLNLLKPRLIKASDHVSEQIELIKRLEQEAYTYVIDDGVYYDTSRFPSYADFAQLDLDEQQAGARVNYNPQKRNIADFALWKFSPTDHQRDMEWDSPWGKGFPGWHIECSAMSLKYLGPTLDIHTGGIDHVPIHHTNEIAQSQAVTGQLFANYWLHSNHVTVNGEKISKSLGNGIRLDDIYKQGIEPEAVRLHILESNYRSQSKFSWESLAAANNRLKDYRAMAALRWQPRSVTHDATTFSLRDVPVQLGELLSNDLNTPEALAFLSNVSSQLQTVHIEADMVDHFEAMLKGIDDVLGLSLCSVKDINQAQKDLIAQRDKARADKNWQLSDAFRQQLLEQGIGLQDHPHGVIWFRV